MELLTCENVCNILCDDDEYLEEEIETEIKTKGTPCNASIYKGKQILIERTLKEDKKEIKNKKDHKRKEIKKTHEHGNMNQNEKELCEHL